MEILSNLNFIVLSILGGIGIALVSGPLGSVLIWQRLSYFGDVLAHSTLLGIGISVLLSINIYIALISICIIMGIIVTNLSKKSKISSDAMLVTMAHTTLAIGLIVASQITTQKFNILNYLYGDILAIEVMDLLWILSIDCFVLSMLGILWDKILSITVNEEIAFVEGINIRKTKLLQMILMSMTFAVSMKLVGALLITGLMIIPASAARLISESPEQMALTATIIGVFSVITGTFISIFIDWPLGPAIVLVASGILISIVLTKKILRRLF